MKTKFTMVLVLILGLLFLSGCAKENKAANVLWPNLIEENAYTLSDGTSVSIYMHGKDIDDPKYYRLDNGAVILVEHDGYYGLWDVLDYERDDIGFDEDDPFLQLSVEIQEKILSHYKQLGLQYDIALELENAYQIYNWYIELGGTYWTGESDEEGVVWDKSPSVHQGTRVYSYNDKMICFYTDISKPLPIAMQPEQNERYHTQDVHSGMYGFYTVFDVTTGEVIPQYDLFTIPKDKIAERLFAISDYLDETERTVMKEQLKSEYIGFSDDELIISFPHETIHGNGYTVTIDYMYIKDILQPWAIPYNEK